MAASDERRISEVWRFEVIDDHRTYAGDPFEHNEEESCGEQVGWCPNERGRMDNQNRSEDGERNDTSELERYTLLNVRRDADGRYDTCTERQRVSEPDSDRER